MYLHVHVSQVLYGRGSYMYRRLRNKVHGDIFILSNTPTYAHGWKAENETSSVHPFFLDNYDVMKSYSTFCVFLLHHKELVFWSFQCRIYYVQYTELRLVRLRVYIVSKYFLRHCQMLNDVLALN